MRISNEYSNCGTRINFNNRLYNSGDEHLGREQIQRHRNLDGRISNQLKIAALLHEANIQTIFLYDSYSIYTL